MHAVMRMQGHPTGTGLTLEQKKSKLWGSKAAPADVAQVSLLTCMMHNRQTNHGHDIECPELGPSSMQIWRKQTESPHRYSRIYLYFTFTFILNVLGTNRGPTDRIQHIKTHYISMCTSTPGHCSS